MEEVIVSPKELRRRQQLFLATILISISSIYLIVDSTYSWSLYRFNYTNTATTWKSFKKPVIARWTRTSESEMAKDDRFLVNTPSCRILNIHPRNKQVLPYLSNSSKPEDCHQKYPEWTYIENTDLLINKTAIREAGLLLRPVSCCYHSIKRVKQSLEKFNGKADRQIKLSKSCKRIYKNRRNPLKDNFIQVQCRSKVFSKDVVFTFLHAIPQLTRASKTVKKIQYWNRLLGDEDKGNIYSYIVPPLFNQAVQYLKGNQPTQKKPKLSRERIPPNVILLGMDSMSRLNFHRYMIKTKEYLELIGAVELRGYAKVGEGTYANAMPFLAGYSVDHLESVGVFSSSTPHDLLPYIWKPFNEANYLTSYSEDGNTFTYNKAGFVKQPVDFYFRTFVLALRQKFDDNLNAMRCAGSKTTLQTIQKFINDSLEFASRNKTPIFIYNWSDFAHENFNLARLADIDYYELLMSIDLNNTILFMFGDHGARYGGLRDTFMGWLEDKLVAFWVYLPENIRQQYPTWIPSLRRNSERLTSHFDFYHTLVHIVKTFTPVKNIPDAMRNNTNVPRRYGQTLFEDVPPARNCQEVGVPANMCPCGSLRPVPTNDSRIINATKSAILLINQKIPKVCAQLHIRNITSGATMYDLHENSTVTNSTIPYVVKFETSPGGFLLEATVAASVESKLRKYHLMGTLLRINKMNMSHVGCIRDAVLEKFCFCLENRKSSHEKHRLVEREIME